MAVLTDIPRQGIPLYEGKSNLMSRQWYLFMEGVYNATGIGRSLLSWLVEVTGDYSPTNEDQHLVCSGTLTITLQPPTSRDYELIITNAGTGIISLVGTVNGDTDKKIRYQNTSIRLRPTSTEYKIV